jgi:hypothetical protein
MAGGWAKGGEAYSRSPEGSRRARERLTGDTSGRSARASISGVVEAGKDKKRAFWSTLWVIALDMVFVVLVLAILLAAELLVSMVSGPVWPGSEWMANLVRIDEWAVLVSLPSFLILIQIGPRDEARSEGEQGEMEAVAVMGQWE